MYCKPIRRKAVSMLFAALVCGHSLSAASHAGARNISEHLRALTQGLAYDRIISEYEGFQWAESSDPEAVMLYVNALVEQGRMLPPALDVPSVPGHVAGFARGYFALLHGHVSEAANVFGALSQTANGRDWGLVGLLELGIMTGMPREMSAAIAALERSKEAFARQSLPYYSVWSCLINGDLNGLRERVAGFGERLDPVVRAEWLVRLFVREDRFAEARGVLKGLPDKVRNAQQVVLAEEELVDKQHGEQASEEFLRLRLERSPQMWGVKLWYAYRLVGSGRGGDVERGREMLRSLLRERSFDWMAQLQIARILLEHGGGWEAVDVLRARAELAWWVPQYHVVQGIAHLRARKIEKAQEQVSIARELAPMDPDVLWLSREVARDSGDVRGAIFLGESLLALDPKNVDSLLEVTELYVQSARWSEAIRVVERVLRLQRYVSHTSQDQARLAGVRSLVGLGRLQEAAGMMNEIRDRKIAMEAREWLNKGSTKR